MSTATTTQRANARQAITDALTNSAPVELYSTPTNRTLGWIVAVNDTHVTYLPAVTSNTMRVPLDAVREVEAQPYRFATEVTR
jgi:hypothetical protein